MDVAENDLDAFRKLIDELAADKAGQKARSRACETFADALSKAGLMLWMTGYHLGADRVSGASPFDFGNDEAVGIATVAQIGGELGTGAIALLKADNKYAAAALTRQLVEVEYLAAAFAEEHEIAADWLRSDSKRRQQFWSPKHLRKRANGAFLNSDYWSHCDMGGHPSTDGMVLLPGHQDTPIALSWADLAGHLLGIWKSVLRATERVLDSPIPPEWKLPDVPAVVARWEQKDPLTAALRALHQLKREDPKAFDFSEPTN
jgi:hypothetical protein